MNEDKIKISINEEDVQNIIDCYEKDIKHIEALEKENQQLKHILDELEKWLEEEITTIKTTFSQVNGNYFIMNDRIEVLEDTLDKLKELRGRENE